jgi:hypothetical protein
MSRPRKPLANFDTINFIASFKVKNTYRCRSCSTEFEAIHVKILEKRRGCPSCGNYESCSPMPKDILKDCKVISHPEIQEDTYWITNKGTVYSTIGKLKEIKQSTTDTGHKTVHIARCNGKIKKIFVHRLVMETWGSKQPSSNHLVRHKNDIPDDNHIDNLIWGLCVENMKDKEENESKRMELIKRIHGAGFTPEEISIATKIKLDCVESILK